jgi:RNA polymerase sigma factor (TIGR02999 family)
MAKGDTAAVEQLLPMVYDQLRAMAASKLRHERPDHTLQATALVHEVFFKLFGKGANVSWTNRKQFFCIAANTMRRILIDSARAKRAKKRSVCGDDSNAASRLDADSNFDIDLLLDLDELLSQLEVEDPGAAALVKLRLYAGLSTTKAAEVLGISRSKAYEDWLFARFWFSERMA